MEKCANVKFLTFYPFSSGRFFHFGAGPTVSRLMNLDSRLTFCTAQSGSRIRFLRSDSAMFT